MIVYCGLSSTRALNRYRSLPWPGLGGLRRRLRPVSEDGSPCVSHVIHGLFGLLFFKVSLSHLLGLKL